MPRRAHHYQAGETGGTEGASPLGFQKLNVLGGTWGTRYGKQWALVTDVRF